MRYERDAIDEALTDAQREMWEAIGILNFAKSESLQHQQPATADRIAETITMLTATVDNMRVAIRTHRAETPAF